MKTFWKQHELSGARIPSLNMLNERVREVIVLFATQSFEALNAIVLAKGIEGTFKSSTLSDPIAGFDLGNFGCITGIRGISTAFEGIRKIRTANTCGLVRYNLAPFAKWLQQAMKSALLALLNGVCSIVEFTLNGPHCGHLKRWHVAYPTGRISDRHLPIEIQGWEFLPIISNADEHRSSPRMKTLVSRDTGNQGTEA